MELFPKGNRRKRRWTRRRRNDGGQEADKEKPLRGENTGMVRPVHLAHDVREIREALVALEADVLSEAAASLAEAAEVLERVAVRLEASRPHEWLSHEEAAVHLRMVDSEGKPQVDYLYKLAYSEGIPRHKLGDRWRYSVKELDEWLMEH
jgi:hypothetical protein